jgi:NADPH:quinone reductase-like Zn-dependent oxidoreductase
MKAIVLRDFGSSDNFVYANLPIPELRTGDVRVRIKAVSFNPVDYQIRKGLPEGARLRSMILGRDLSGVVEAVHASGGNFSIGDEVFGYVCDLSSNGTYAEHVSVPHELLALKPASLSHAQAAAVPVAGITASLALDKTWADSGKSVFVAGGAGGVGTFAHLLLRHLGVRNLVTTAGSARSRAYLIERCGLREAQIIDYRQGDFVAQALRRNGGGFDIALDFVGGRMLSACCALLAVDGHFASVTETPGREDFELLFQRNASFHTIGANAYSLVGNRVSWRTYGEILERLAHLFDSGALTPPPVHVLGRLSAAVVRRGHALLEGNSVQGKLVMICD